jgi:acetyl-CoA acetyltransferase
MERLLEEGGNERFARCFLCDAVRTPIGRYGGALAHVRTDDLAAIPIRGLVKRHPDVDWSALDEVVFGCANQAGRTIATSLGWLSCLRACRIRSLG